MIHIKSEVQRGRTVLELQGDPRGNQYSSHLLHHIKSMLASCGQRHPNTQPTNAYGAVHTHLNTINHTHAFKKASLKQIAASPASCTYSSFWASAAGGEGGGEQESQQQMIKARQKVRRRDNMAASQSAGSNMSTLPRFQVIEKRRRGRRMGGIMERCCTTRSTFRRPLKSGVDIYSSGK